ncbi:hypothetical protein Lepto7375DRAFT_1650 [Leptolyngbya sp. PCC 7375]|nr:hypothetical protein Lepto7375DRAFT_1650 [Leptolyngbya sp. PCC 7375]
MQLYDSPRPWVIYRRLPNFQHIAVARFQRRTDAEQYLATLQYLIPQSPFLMTFDTDNIPMENAPHRHRLRYYLVRLDRGGPKWHLCCILRRLYFP